MKNRQPPRGPRWSKLKSRVEALWAPELRMGIHCSVHAWYSRQNREMWREPRHWIALDKRVLWDFPRPFFPEGDATRGEPIPYFEAAYSWYEDGPSAVSAILRDYLDRPADKLFEPFERDGWELTDILRAADRRIGRKKLLAWEETLDDKHPALPVIAARYGREAVWGPGEAGGEAA